MAYDIIGDIHGQALMLESLLSRLGYRNKAGLWQHPGRTALFVGDFIDRGPHQLDTVDLVRRMVEEGKAQAVMGNHEFNAIAWHTPHPDGGGDYLRTHNHPVWGKKNRHQHAHFLAELEQDPVRHRTVIDWFMTLPLWLDLPGVRVVHACWHQPFMDWLQPHLADGNRLHPEMLESATLEPEDEAEKDNATPSVFKAVEALTKGLETPLPPGHTFIDKDGIGRDRVRVRWWDADATHYPEAAMLDEAARSQLPRLPIPSHTRIQLSADKPVFFGHYWLRGDPAVLSSHAACVDYSAGKDGSLVAYRWDGESRLSDRSFVEIKR